MNASRLSQYWRTLLLCVLVGLMIMYTQYDEDSYKQPRPNIQSYLQEHMNREDGTLVNPDLTQKAQTMDISSEEEQNKSTYSTEETQSSHRREKTETVDLTANSQSNKLAKKAQAISIRKNGQKINVPKKAQNINVPKKAQNVNVRVKTKNKYLREKAQTINLPEKDQTINLPVKDNNINLTKEGESNNLIEKAPANNLKKTTQNVDLTVNTKTVYQKTQTVNLTATAQSSHFGGKAKNIKKEKTQASNVTEKMQTIALSTSPPNRRLKQLDNGFNLLLFTAYRSGSSFTGQLFGGNVKMLYLFEPFKLWELGSSAEHRKTQHVLIQERFAETTREIFNCNFTYLIDYAIKRFGRKHKYVSMETSFNISLGIKGWYRNIFGRLATKGQVVSPAKNATWKISRSNLTEQCMAFKYRVAKVIRGRYLSFLEPILQEELSGGRSNYVLYLVRDPRGVITSRYRLKQMNEHTPKIFLKKKQQILAAIRNRCTIYKQNMEFLAKYFNGTNKFKIRMIRYEDIAYNPMVMASNMYSFLHITLPKSVVKWIKRSTDLPTNSTIDAFGTIRDSAKTAEAWRKYVPYDLALGMDAQCKDVLPMLGYQRVTDRNSYLNMSYSLVNSLKLPYVIQP